MTATIRDMEGKVVGLEDALKRVIDQTGGPPNNGGSGGPPVELNERVAKLEVILPTLATKEDLAWLDSSMHKAMNTQTWRIIAAAAGLVAAVYFIARHAPPGIAS